MRNLIPLALLLIPAAARAGSYVPQASFAVAVSTVAGLDSDSVGNLYVLGRATGAATYGVRGYRTPALEPLFAFDAGVSTPAAFAVEPSGMIDVLDGAGGSYTLRRFQNTGVPAGVFSISLGLVPNIASVALDKWAGRVYVAYQTTQGVFHPLCLGCGGPSSVTRTSINQYDMQGNLVATGSMPGVDTTSGSCYTPTALAAGPGGELDIADAQCANVLKFTNLALSGTYPASGWVGSFQPRAMWTDAADFLYISQPVCGPTGCPWGVVKLAGGAMQTSFAADSAVGCAWDSRILYLSSSGASPLRRFVYASPLSVPAETGPIGTGVQHSSAATFAWQASNSPDSDPIVYTVLLGTAAASLAPLGSASQSPWTSAPLAFGATYFWQVSAQSSYLGLPVQTAQAPVVSFNQNLVNTAPASFAVAGGTGTVATRSTSATFAWQAASDADGDLVVYDFFWRGPGQSSATLAGSTSDTSWAVAGLSFQTTYYWSVRARDVYGVSTWLAGGTEQAYRPVFANAAPPAPAVLSGNGVTAQHTLSPQTTLAWASVDDPDGDPVAYRVFLGTAPSALALAQDSTATSLSLPGMTLGATYYWQVTAYDPYGGTGATTVLSARAVLANQAPGAFAVLAGSGTVVTRAEAQTLLWSSALDPDGDAVTYELSIGTAPSALSLAQSGPSTSYSGALPFGATSYWQVVARDSFGAAQASPVQGLFLAFKNAPPAPPLVLLGTGTVAVHALAPQASLSWSAAADPDGDPVAYRLFFGTSPAALALAQDGAAMAATIPGLQLDTAYFWQLAAYDPFGGASTGAVQNLRLRLSNQPPAPVVYLTTAAVVAVHAASATATLAWSPAADPDGDAVTYELDLSSGSGTAAVSMGSSTAYSLALSFDAAYQWRVVAADGFGGVSTAPWLPLTARLANLPPNPIQYLAPAALKTRATSYLLTWGDSGDPDGDPVAYRLEVGVSSGALAAVQQSSAAAYLLPLQFGTTVYYRVTALDSFNAATAGGVQAFLPVFLNDPPQSPNVMSPFKTSPVVKTMKNAVSVSWEQVTNPENDPIRYTVYFGAAGQGMTPLAAIDQTAAAGTTALALRPLGITPQAQVQLDGSTIILNLSGLDYYRNYTLQVVASNPYGAASAAPAQTFSLSSADGFPKAYNYPNPFSPTRGGTNLVFNAPPSGYARATVEIYSEWQDLLYKQDFFNIAPGISQVHLDGRDRYGRPFFNGSYVCRVRFSGPDDRETFYLMVVK